jgi:hypothetical protein
MTMMDKMVTDNSNGRLVERMERNHAAHLAHHLSSVAVRQWEKALTGVVAMPAAAALGVAAVATFGVAVAERLFEVIESSVGEIGRTIAQDDGMARDGDGSRQQARL